LGGAKKSEKGFIGMVAGKGVSEGAPHAHVVRRKSEKKNRPYSRRWGGGDDGEEGPWKSAL